MKTFISVAVSAIMSLPVVGQTAEQPGSGNCLNFSDGQQVIVGTNASLRPTTALSLTTWIRYTGTGADTDHLISNNWPDFTPSGYALGMVWNSADDISFTTGTGTVTANNVIPNNEWCHVAATWDGTTQSIYINGVLAATNAWSGTISYADNPTFRIGMAYNPAIDPDRAWVGDMDEITVWNRALTPTEIRENMCTKLTGNESGLLAYWRMDEGADNSCSGGQDVCDASPNNNHGTKF